MSDKKILVEMSKDDFDIITNLVCDMLVNDVAFPMYSRLYESRYELVKTVDVPEGEGCEIEGSSPVMYCSMLDIGETYPKYCCVIEKEVEPNKKHPSCTGDRIVMLKKVVE